MQDLCFSHAGLYLTATHWLPKYSSWKSGFCQRALELLLSSLVPPPKVSMVHAFIFCTLIKYILLSKSFQHCIELKLPPLILSHYPPIFTTVLATLIIIYSCLIPLKEKDWVYSLNCALDFNVYYTLQTIKYNGSERKINNSRIRITIKFKP